MIRQQVASPADTVETKLLGPPRDPRIAVEVPPRAVRAGEPFALVLRARVPKTGGVAFPVGPDSGRIEAVQSPATEVRPAGSDSVEVVTTYRLVAWETGARAVPFGQAVFTVDGRDERAEVGMIPVTVESVLPGEGQVEPRPARAPFDQPLSWWRDALAVTIALLVGSLLVWWAMHRRTRPVAAAAARRRADPAAALAALERLDLDRSGEPARLLLGAADAVREALAQAHPRTRVLTTEALVRTSLAGVPMARVVSLLEDADAARYGRAPVSVERARRALAEAKALLPTLATAGVVDRVGAAR